AKVGAQFAELLDAFARNRFDLLLDQRAAELYGFLLQALSPPQKELEFCRARLTELARLAEDPAEQLGALASGLGRQLLPPDCDTPELILRWVEERVGEKELT